MAVSRTLLPSPPNPDQYANTDQFQADQHQWAINVLGKLETASRAAVVDSTIQDANIASNTAGLAAASVSIGSHSASIAALNGLISKDASNNTIVTSPAATQIKLQQGSVTNLTLDASGNVTATGTAAVSAVSATGTVTAGAVASTGTITAAAVVSTGLLQGGSASGIVMILTDPNGAIEIGQQGRASAGTPYIDFHSSAGSPDYDARIQVTGGTSTAVGAGTLTLYAASASLTGALSAASLTISPGTTFLGSTSTGNLACNFLTTPTGINGAVSINQGNTANPGFINFINPLGTRVGYLGWQGNTGYLQLESENGYAGWQVTGNLIVNGVATAANGTTGTQVVNYSQFAPSLSNPGYTKMPGGYLIQWHRFQATVNNGVNSVNFATAFPSAFLLQFCAWAEIGAGSGWVLRAQAMSGTTWSYSWDEYSTVGSGASVFINMIATGF